MGIPGHWGFPRAARGPPCLRSARGALAQSRCETPGGSGSLPSLQPAWAPAPPVAPPAEVSWCLSCRPERSQGSCFRHMQPACLGFLGKVRLADHSRRAALAEGWHVLAPQLEHQHPPLQCWQLRLQVLADALRRSPPAWHAQPALHLALHQRQWPAQAPMTPALHACC